MKLVSDRDLMAVKYEAEFRRGIVEIGYKPGLH